MLKQKNTIIVSTSVFAVLSAIFVILYSAQPKHKKANYLEAIKIAVNNKVENESISCGFMSVELDPYSFNKCVINAESNNNAYWVAYQVQGQDSIVWLLFSKSASGSYEQKIFDSYSNAESDTVVFKHVHTESCPSVLFSPGNLSEQQLHSERVFGC